MLTSISPLGERARGNRWATTVTAYVVGSALGGLTIGTVLGGVGSPLSFAPLVAALVCALALVADLIHVLPTLHRQVDEDWLGRYRGWVYGGGFGVQLGLGVVTIVTSAATYAALALCLLSGSIRGGALIGLAFGLARALPILRLRRATTPDALRQLAAGRDRLSSRATSATAVVLAAAAAALVVTA